MVQGTNLQHALMLASRHLANHPDAEPVVMVVTDGEPTAHLLPDGSAWFDWPTHPETTAATMAEVERVTRRGATINVFMLDDEPGLVRFVEAMAARNGGRVFSPDAARLGEYVVSDYLRARRGRRARRLTRSQPSRGRDCGCRARCACWSPWRSSSRSASASSRRPCRCSHATSGSAGPPPAR